MGFAIVNFSSELFYRLEVRRCFFVKSIGGVRGVFLNGNILSLFN